MDPRERTPTFAGRPRLVLALMTAFSASAGSAAPQVGSLAEIVTPVTVTDGAGRAVTGLDQRMFRVELNGEPAELVSVAVSDDIAASIVFAPSVVKRWRKIRDRTAESVRESATDEPVIVVLSRDEPGAEDASGEVVRFAQPKDRYRWRGDELAGMIALGLDSMQAVPSKKGLRRAVFIIVESPTQDLRHYRKSLLKQAAASDVQVYALWRSQRRYPENEGRSMLVLEELVERTGGRAAQFSSQERIPAIVAQFAAALRAAYELRLRVPATHNEHRLEVEVLMPEQAARVHVSFRRRARVEPK